MNHTLPDVIVLELYFCMGITFLDANLFIKTLNINNNDDMSYFLAKA